MITERPNIVDPDDQFVQHSYNALFAGGLQQFETNLQREMVMTVADHILNQMDKDFAKEFLAYVRRRVETN